VSAEPSGADEGLHQLVHVPRGTALGQPALADGLETGGRGSEVCGTQPEVSGEGFG
jgi:hypothetical protein